MSANRQRTHRRTQKVSWSNRVTTETMTTVDFTSQSDSGEDDSETVILTVEAGVDYTVGSPNSANIVIVDAPPLNVLTDAAEISAAVDGVLVITREGQTDQRALQLTLERLDRTGSRVLGLVLNGSRLPAYYKSYSYVYG